MKANNTKGDTTVMYIRPLFTILVSALVAASSALRAGDSRPNIIFLLTDDQTVGAVGCYGNKDIITPNIDKLASEGVRFANHYNTTPICMASRASLMTGLHEYRHGCNFGHGVPVKREWDHPSNQSPPYPLVL